MKKHAEQQVIVAGFVTLALVGAAVATAATFAQMTTLAEGSTQSISSSTLVSSSANDQTTSSRPSMTDELQKFMDMHRASSGNSAPSDRTMPPPRPMQPMPRSATTMPRTEPQPDTNVMRSSRPNNDNPVPMMGRPVFENNASTGMMRQDTENHTSDTTDLRKLMEEMQKRQSDGSSSSAHSDTRTMPQQHETDTHMSSAMGAGAAKNPEQNTQMPSLASLQRQQKKLTQQMTSIDRRIATNEKAQTKLQAKIDKLDVTKDVQRIVSIQKQIDHLTDLNDTLAIRKDDLQIDIDDVQAQIDDLQSATTAQ